MLYDPATGRERRRWSLDAPALLGAKEGGHRSDSNRGFEGLAFREDRAGAGKGRLYLVHQSKPTTVVVLAFDPSQPAGALAAEAVIARWPLERYENVTGAAYVPTLDRLLLIAERADRLLVVTEGGRVEREIPLPGLQQEGVCLDGQGALWVADDRAGTLVRFPGALDVLRKPGARGTGAPPPVEEQP
jgi:uncharacterized protein YjiK